MLFKFLKTYVLLKKAKMVTVELVTSQNQEMKMLYIYQNYQNVPT